MKKSIKRYIRRKHKKTDKIIIFTIFALLFLSSFSAEAVYEELGFWRLIDNDTITPLNESYNMSVGENKTTSHKLFVNGTLFVNDTATFVGGIIVQDNIYVADKIFHYNDGDTYLYFGEDTVIIFAGGRNMLDFREVAGQDIVIGNAYGAIEGDDIDFQWWQTTLQTKFFHLDGLLGYVGIGTSTPEQLLDVVGTGNITGTLNIRGNADVVGNLSVVNTSVSGVLNVTGDFSGSSWSYYKTVRVANKISDYQMKIVVDYNIDKGGNVSCESHCQTDFDDIRFIYNNITLLPYWIENYTLGVQATFWVNISIYDIFEMMYGNADVSSVSDGETTFDFFDDFNDASIDNAKWDTYGGTPEVDFKEESGYLSIIGAGGIHSDTVFDYPVRLLGSTKFDLGVGSYAYFGYRGDSDVGGILAGYSQPDTATDWQCYINDGSWNSVQFGTPVADFIHVEIESSTGNQNLYMGVDTSLNTYTIGSAQQIIWYGGVGDSDLDWVALAKWVTANRPSWVGFSSEQSSSYSTIVGLYGSLWLNYVSTGYDMSLYTGNIAINGTTGLIGTRLLDSSWYWR